jgi:signal transduction histidine kinase
MSTDDHIDEATRVRSQFQANLSHELRTPLAGIIGYAELLLGESAGALAPTQRRYVGDVLAGARQMLQLVTDVLDLAKLQAGQMPFHAHALDLHALVDDVREVLSALAARKNLRLEAEVDPRVRRVTADGGKLKQVLGVFGANAIQFTPEGGRVTLRAGTEDGNRFRIEVEDSGSPIPAGEMGRLFQAFPPLEHGTPGRRGDGLGLALVQGLIEAQGGTVGARSQPGRGSLFFAVLPRTVRPPPRPAVAPQGGGR